MLHYRSVGRVYLRILSCHLFFVFHRKICVFIIFIFFIEFLQQIINQSQTGIGDKKLSVELYVYNIYSHKTFKITLRKTKLIFGCTSEMAENHEL